MTTGRFARIAKASRATTFAYGGLSTSAHIDASVDLLGVKYETPIVINPLGSQKAFHPQGEIAVARAAKAKGH